MERLASQGSVGTRGGCGAGWGPCACPGGNAIPWGLLASQGSVGTRGGCGAGWGPCACPGGNAIPWGLHGANRSQPNQDKHKAPSSTPPRPLSLQDEERTLPDSVVKIR